MNPNLIKEVTKRINKLQKGKKFTVKELFGDDWDKYSKNVGPNQFGKDFKKEYDNKNLAI